MRKTGVDFKTIKHAIAVSLQNTFIWQLMCF